MWEIDYRVWSQVLCRNWISQIQCELHKAISPTGEGGFENIGHFSLNDRWMGETKYLIVKLK